MNKDTKIIPATIERDGEIYVHVSDILTEKEINGKLQQELERYKNSIERIQSIYISMQFSAPENMYVFIDRLGEILEELKGSDN